MVTGPPLPDGVCHDHRRPGRLSDRAARHRGVGCEGFPQPLRILRGRQAPAVLGHRLQLERHGGERLAPSGPDRHGLHGRCARAVGRARGGPRGRSRLGIRGAAVQAGHGPVRFDHRGRLPHGEIRRFVARHPAGERGHHLQYGRGLHGRPVHGVRQGVRRLPRHRLRDRRPDRRGGHLLLHDGGRIQSGRLQRPAARCADARWSHTVAHCRRGQCGAAGRR